MIRIGQAGIPLSCKGRTNKDGLVYTKEYLNLNAMEIQFVRGLYVMSDEEAQFIRDYSKENDVELHVHAPYYINLAGGEETDFSFDKVMFSARLADKMGAKTVVVHPGYYGEESEKKTLKKIIKNTKKLQSMIKKEKTEVDLIDNKGHKVKLDIVDEPSEVVTDEKGNKVEKKEAVGDLEVVDTSSNEDESTESEEDIVSEEIGSLQTDELEVEETPADPEVEKRIQEIKTEGVGEEVEKRVEEVFHHKEDAEEENHIEKEEDLYTADTEEDTTEQEEEPEDLINHQLEERLDTFLESWREDQLIRRDELLEDPEKEFEETLNKARGLRRAVELAEKGL